MFIHTPLQALHMSRVPRNENAISRNLAKERLQLGTVSHSTASLVDLYGRPHGRRPDARGPKMYVPHPEGGCRQMRPTLAVQQGYNAAHS